MKKLLSGKVRDVYEVDDKTLAIVTTDRISAFDVILDSTIPNKGVALNLISLYWFAYTGSIVPNHILSAQLADMPACFAQEPQTYALRTVLVKKLKMLPYEFVVRGHLFGSMWEAYRSTGSFCGVRLAPGLTLAQRLDEPMLTPAAKNAEGHDEYIPLERLRSELGRDTADTLCKISMALYRACYAHALEKGIVLADTKFEFGYDENGVLTLGDEIFTPDSSRFWSLSDWQRERSTKSFDKQFVRDWLIERQLNGVTPAPALPEDVIRATSEIYRACYQRITGREEFTLG